MGNHAKNELFERKELKPLRHFQNEGRFCPTHRIFGRFKARKKQVEKPAFAERGYEKGGFALLRNGIERGDK